MHAALCVIFSLRFFLASEGVIYFPAIYKYLRHQVTGMGLSPPLDGTNGYLVPAELLGAENDGCRPIRLGPTGVFASTFCGLRRENQIWIALLRESPACSMQHQILQMQAAGAAAVVVATREPVGRTQRDARIRIPATTISIPDYECLLAMTERFKGNGFLYAVVGASRYAEAGTGFCFVFVSFGAAVVILFAIYNLVKALSYDDRARDGLLTSESDLQRIPPLAATRELACDRCPICLDEYELGSRVRILPCSHRYHLECVDSWLLTKSSQCPMCKRNVRAMLDSRAAAK